MKDTAPATRKDIDDILKVIGDFVERVDERFTQQDFKSSARFHTIEANIANLQKSYDHLLQTID